MNGDTQSEGVVEMCFNSGWGTVCDNDWSNNNAMVVCNQLDINSTSMLYKLQPKLFIIIKMEPLYCGHYWDPA